MSAFKNDLAGRRFGKLVVIEPTEKRSFANVLWLCRCDCGESRLLDRIKLLTGNTTSCGCERKRLMATSHNPNLKHGQARVDAKGSLYYIWKGMRQRCNDQNHKDYHRYGGRGIVVCERWNDYQNFAADMGERPSINHSIDRYPDCDGNYEPGNVRWATAKQQRNNRSAA